MGQRQVRLDGFEIIGIAIQSLVLGLQGVFKAAFSLESLFCFADLTLAIVIYVLTYFSVLMMSGNEDQATSAANNAYDLSFIEACGDVLGF